MTGTTVVNLPFRERQRQSQVEEMGGNLRTDKEVDSKKKNPKHSECPHFYFTNIFMFKQKVGEGLH